MRRLPLFPLPMVLLPGASVPLHVFEPRYRQLVAHCLESDRRFGLIYHDPDRAGPFEIQPGQIGCVAEILDFQPIPDGRSTLIARGVERFRVVDGIESEAMYYEALVEEYEDEPEDEAELAPRVSRTTDLYRRAIEHAGIADLMAPIEPGGRLSFQLAQWIHIDPVWQQEMLESRSEASRLERLDALLSSVLEPEE